MNRFNEFFTYFLLSVAIILLWGFVFLSLARASGPDPTLFKEGNHTCAESREILQGVVGEYFGLQDEISGVNEVMAYTMSEQEKLRMRADFLDKIEAMDTKMSDSWLDCLKSCEED